MTKKNRFSMLEVEKNDQKSTPTEIPEKEENVPKQFKVIVEQDEFRKNLERHRLTEKINNIEKQKIDIKVSVKKIKQQAYLKILAGILIVFYAIRMYVLPQFIGSEYDKTPGSFDIINRYKDSEMTSLNYVIIIVLVILFSYIYLFAKDKGKK